VVVGDVVGLSVEQVEDIEPNSRAGADLIRRLEIEGGGGLVLTVPSSIKSRGPN
jgi:hypothetical protein